MRAVILEPPEWLLEERRHTGLDRLDEVWDGVLHMPPQPSSDHQFLASDLEMVLRPLARQRGLDMTHELSVFDPDGGKRDYRVPDLVIVDRAHTSKRGVEGRAELVIEILSPDDESRDKLPFYAACEIPEVWLIDPATRQVEVFVLRGAGYFAIADDEGVTRAPRLGLALRVVDGPKLRIAWAEGSADI